MYDGKLIAGGGFTTAGDVPTATAMAAGHSPIWGFLVLVPFLNFVAMGVMAFSGSASGGAMPASGQIDTRKPTHVG